MLCFLCIKYIEQIELGCVAAISSLFGIPKCVIISGCPELLVPISMVGTLGWAQWSTIDLAVIVTPTRVKT